MTENQLFGPRIGSVWRENDNRFERLVRVVTKRGGDATAPKVGIVTISYDLVKPPRTRVTYAKAAAFGSRYLFVSDGGGQ